MIFDSSPYSCWWIIRIRGGSVFVMFMSKPFPTNLHPWQTHIHMIPQSNTYRSSTLGIWYHNDKLKVPMSPCHFLHHHFQSDTIPQTGNCHLLRCLLTVSFSYKWSFILSYFNQMWWAGIYLFQNNWKTIIE